MSTCNMSIIWSGKDNTGNLVSNGMYLITFQIGNKIINTNFLVYMRQSSLKDIFLPTKYYV